VKRLSGKSTNSEELFLKIHQLQSIHTVVEGFSDNALCSWWIIGTSTLQMAGYWNKHFAVGGFFELALWSWSIFRTSTSQLVDFH